MDKNEAYIEGSGPNAQKFANAGLSALGVDPDEVVEIEVEVTTANGKTTKTTLNSDGPDAGFIARAMMNGVDWAGHRPTKIEMGLVTENAETDLDEDEETTRITFSPEEDEDEEDVQTATDEEEAETDEPDEEDGEVEGGSVEALTPNTPPHMALTAVAAHYTKIVSSGGANGGGDDKGGGDNEEYGTDVRGVSARQLARTLDLPIDYNTLAKALSEAASDHAVLEQNVAERNDGATDAYYHLNSVGRAFLNEHGAHADMGEMDISAALEGDVVREGRSYEEMVELRESVAGKSKDMPKGGTRELYIEEPRVDEPQQVSKDTRYHEVIWTLAQWHAENGGETWAPIAELYEFSPFDFPSQGAFGAPASEVFLDHALIERRKVGRTAEVRLNEAGWDEVERLGAPAAAADVEGASESPDELALET